jgi:hypothetical protein
LLQIVKYLMFVSHCGNCLQSRLLQKLIDFVQDAKFRNLNV